MVDKNDFKISTVKESKDSNEREYDYEGEMAKLQLRGIIRNANDLISIMEDNTNLAEWVQNKITKAADYLDVARDYMMNDMHEAVRHDNITTENFLDGKNPQDKGDSKRHGVPTKASVSKLRKVAKQGGRKGQLAHWMANMKAGKAKKKTDG